MTGAFLLGLVIGSVLGVLGMWAIHKGYMRRQELEYKAIIGRLAEFLEKSSKTATLEARLARKDLIDTGSIRL